MLPVDNGIKNTRGFNAYDMSNFEYNLDLDFGENEKDVLPSPGTLPSNITEYKGYYFETGNLNLNLGIGVNNWAYSIYPPSFTSGQFLDYSSLIRLQDGFNTEFEAIAAAKAWIDGLVIGSVDESDQGETDGLDFGIPEFDIDFPDPPTPEEIRDSIENGGSISETSQPMGQFAVVGVVMIGFLGYLFYEAFKKGE